MKKKTIFLLIILAVMVLFIPARVFATETGTFSQLQTLIDNNTELTLDRDYANSGSETQINILNKTITIDLNGHVINGNRTSRVFYVTNSNLTIKDSGTNVEHKFDINDNLLATLNEESGTLTVKGGCITGGNNVPRYSYGNGICLDNATLNLNAGNIIGNTMSGKFQYGAGIAGINNSKIIMNGGSVSYNSIRWEGYGGGIIIDSSEFILNDGLISYNYGTYGGGITVQNNGKLIMNGGDIKGNKSDHNGAGIALFASTTVINGGIIEENINPGTWIGIGGGISTDFGADLTINGGIIRNNQANRGAGIGAWTGGNIKIYGGKITGNISTEDTTPTDCTENNYGAGIYFDTSDTGYKPCETSTLSLGGDVVIKGNINAVTNKEENVYLASGQKINIANGDNAPQKDMKVGITMPSLETFATSVSTDYSNNFIEDDSLSYIKMDGNELKLLERKIIPDIDLTATKPHAGETVENNLFTVTSMHDNIEVRVKEWKLNGSNEALANDYIFIEGKSYIPILEVKVKNKEELFGGETTLTVHGSSWSNKEGTYKLSDHQNYGYVKNLDNDSFLIDEMTVVAGARIPTYTFISGDDFSFIKGKANQFTFKVDGDYNLFEEFIVENLNLIKDTDYTIEEGSTIIKLTNSGTEKLNTLNVGIYNIKVKYSNLKEVEGKLIVKEVPIKMQQYNLKLNKINTNSEKITNDIDLAVYIANKKQEFIKKLNEFKNGKENINIPSFDDLFTENSYVVINDILLKETNIEKSDDAIVTGELTTSFEDIEVLQGSYIVTNEYDINYTVITVLKEEKAEEKKSNNPKTGDTIMIAVAGLAVSVGGLYITKKKFIK